MKRAIILLVVGWAGVGLAQYKETAPVKKEPPTPTAPPYSVVRFPEDYAYLAKAPKTDFFDPIKYMPLNDSGDIYLSVGGQARYRYEYFNNFNFSPPSPPGPPQDETGYHLVRLLLHGDLHIGKNIRIFAQGKSSMEDGREGGPRAVDSDELDVQQLFADVRLDWGKDWNTTIRAGRQDLIYGAQRFISPLDWTNTRRTFEGVGVNNKFGVCAVDVFWVRPVNVENEECNDGDDQTSFAGLYSTTQLPKVLEGGGTKLEAYFLALNRTNAQFAVNAAGPAVDEDRYTVGVRFSSTPKPWDLDVEADYQFGKFDTGDISAWSVAAEVGYTLSNVPTTPRIYLGFDAASGDDDADDDDLETFNQLFPLGHAYFGFIDVIGRQNIIDLHPGIDLTIVQNARFAKKVTLKTDYHLFWRQSEEDAVYNAGAGAGSSPPNAGVLRAAGGSDELFIGSEIDFVLTWQVERHTTLFFGYSHFFAGDFIEETGPSEDIDFFYAILQFTF